MSSPFELGGSSFRFLFCFILLILTTTCNKDNQRSTNPFEGRQTQGIDFREKPSDASPRLERTIEEPGSLE
ncbi:hypothetical protein EDD15DRAFT_2288577 [Pisolithus albus]|nr:hypothetical protein EDD15DRAFT_2288577 [Pisolithus albus]